MEHLQEKSPHDTVISPRFISTGVSGSASMSSPIFAMSPADAHTHGIPMVVALPKNISAKLWATIALNP